LEFIVSFETVVVQIESGCCVGAGLVADTHAGNGSGCTCLKKISAFHNFFVWFVVITPPN